MKEKDFSVALLGRIGNHTHHQRWLEYGNPFKSE